MNHRQYSSSGAINLVSTYPTLPTSKQNQIATSAVTVLIYFKYKLSCCNKKAPKFNGINKIEGYFSLV